DHVGENFRVKGPHLAEPSRQRTPVLFQATGSPAGIAFAGRHAEVVFTGGRSVDDFRRNAQSMRDAAISQDRAGEDLKFIVQAGVVVGRTDEEAADKLRTYRRFQSLDGILAHASLPVDLTAYPRETLLSDIPGVQAGRFAVPGATVGEALDKIVEG